MSKEVKICVPAVESIYYRKYCTVYKTESIGVYIDEPDLILTSEQWEIIANVLEKYYRKDFQRTNFEETNEEYDNFESSCFTSDVYCNTELGDILNEALGGNSPYSFIYKGFKGGHDFSQIVSSHIHHYLSYQR